MNGLAEVKAERYFTDWKGKTPIGRRTKKCQHFIMLAFFIK